MRGDHRRSSQQWELDRDARRIRWDLQRVLSSVPVLDLQRRNCQRLAIRLLDFHPNGKVLYAINELKNTVSAYTYSAETGKLAELQAISTLPADFTGKSYCADLKITPDGRYEPVAGALDSLAVAGASAVQFGTCDKILYITTSGAQAGPVNGTVIEPGKLVKLEL